MSCHVFCLEEHLLYLFMTLHNKKKYKELKKNDCVRVRSSVIQ